MTISAAAGKALAGRTHHVKTFITALAIACAVAFTCLAAFNATAAQAEKIGKVNVTSCNTAISAVNYTVKRVAVRKVEVKYLRTKNVKRNKRAALQLKKARAAAAKARAAVRKYCSPNGSVSEWSGPCFRAIETLEKSVALAAATRIKTKRTKLGKRLTKKQANRRRKTLKRLDDKVKKNTQIIQTACGGPNSSNGGPTGSTGSTGGGNTTITGPTGPTNGNPTFTITPQPAGATIECKIDGGAYIVVTSPYTPDVSGLAEGVHTLTCRSVVDGIPGPEQSYEFTIDRTAPTVTVSVPDPTNDTTPPVSLTSNDPDATFECKVDGGAYSGVPANFDLPTQLEGVHTLTCRAIDEAGNVGNPDARVFTVDTTAPAKPIVTGPTGATNDNTPTYTVTPLDTGDTAECRVDGGSWQAAPGGTFTPTLADGTHTIECRVTDAAGNTSPISDPKNVTVDTSAPGAPTVSGPSGTTGDNTPTYTVTPLASGDTAQCRVDGGAWQAAPGGSFTPTLPDGAHTIECRVIDEAGNPGTPSSPTFVTVDTQPPSTTLAGPTLTNDKTPTFSVSSTEPGTSECKVGAGAYTAVAGGQFTTAELADGDYTITCRSTDAAGNVGDPVSQVVTIDTTGPAKPTVTGPTGLTNDSTPTYTVSPVDAGETAECRVDGGAWQAAPGASFTPSLPDGAHTIECRVIDAAGNPGEVSDPKSVTVDTSAPGTPTVTGPSGTTNDSTPSYTVSPVGPGETAECRVDGGAWQNAPGGSFNPSLADGTHTIECRVVDAAGNPGGVSDPKIVTVDTSAPGAPTVSGPTGLTSDATPTYTVSPIAAGDTAQCRVDGGAWQSAPAGSFTPTLADGAHTIDCRVTDAAGNVGAPSTPLNVTVDTVAPSTTLAGPTTTNDNTPPFTVSSTEPGSTIECKLDDGSYIEVGPAFDLPEVDDGAHTVTCRSTDAAGNVGDPVSHVVTVDTVAPAKPTVSGPTGATNDSTPTYTVSPVGPGDTAQCRVDGGAWQAAPGGTFTPTLTDGTHTIECRVTDAAGNTSPVSDPVSVTVDTSAPAKPTVSGPTGATNDSTPTYTVSPVGPGDTAECRVDGGAWQAAPGGSFTPTLADGTHTIECRVIDEAGNPSPISDPVSVTVDTVAPTPPGVSGPSGLINDSTPTYTVSPLAPGDTAQCRVDGGAWQAAPGGTFTPTLTDGAHSIDCRVTDAAGNSSTPSSPVNVTVDATAPSTTLSGPTATNDNTPTFNVGATEAGTTECRVDGGAWQTVAGGQYTTAMLNDGSHTVSCRTTDTAGNVGSTVSQSVTIDTVAPTLTMTGPSGLQPDSTPTYTLAPSEAGSTLECAIDGGSFNTVTSPYTTPDLVEGTHTISCRAVDALGNVGPAQSKTTTIGTPYTDPQTVLGSGSLGLGCTPLDFILPLGCPSGVASLTIPAHPNGLAGNYQVNLSGYFNDICSLAGVLPSYTMNITVDGVSVASDSDGALLNLLCIGGVDLAASRLNYTLSSSTAHTIRLQLRSNLQLSVLPGYSSAGLTVDVVQL